jgi:hypothetical protein
MFSSLRRPDRLWDSPNLLSNGYRVLFPPWVKRQWREADHSPPTSAHKSSCCSVGTTLLYLAPIVARQWLGENVTVTMNTRATIEELLEALSSVRFVSYQGM